MTDRPQEALARRAPLFAVLRGLPPQESEAVGAVLVDSGFEILEVTMNSPSPFESIATLARTVGDCALVGAGTIVSNDQVDLLEQAGGRLVVSPHCDATVISYAATKGLVSLPGVLTPTEMFSALKAGATGLKIFPAELFTPAAIRAVRAVLPTETPIYVVGGINADNMATYIEAGATGFGLGSSLYRPGKTLTNIEADAKSIVAAFRSACGKSQ